MLKAFANILKVEELRNRILFTAGIIILVRVAANIPVPESILRLLTVM